MHARWRQGVDLVLRYSTADGSAVAPLDYTALPVSMTTFAARTSDKNVTVALTGGNRIQEPDKSFVVQLALFYGATQVSSANVTINIKDDDWTVDVTVNFTTRDITATAAADYTATSGSLTFTPANWAVPQQVTVDILRDVLFEADETFAIDISVAAPFASIVNASASSSIVTIRNTLVQCEADEQMATLVPDILGADPMAAALLIECRGRDAGALQASIDEVTRALVRHGLPFGAKAADPKAIETYPFSHDAKGPKCR
ncbi:glycolate dehydrogenase [Monoraphidium neglectum]|uniref:Glycolate dehydrogenase n=1 Tax=Monoraphidium neglectum TaxID=145388 RepID=A0A0D2MM61_9CHLO|nr:glycolate dehydrogenase [Monoraphidium neglectum]KIY95905.1 glycolate dehydrogenase [Monoraphidium neglectum]|eukprot:XP_013894925.1 glycolate dehydrogenase [Monoraphidium neglectum]